jgi:hypothetical protein
MSTRYFRIATDDSFMNAPVCLMSVIEAHSADSTQQYLPGMWATIAMHCLYSIDTIYMSMYLTRMNRLVDHGSRSTPESMEVFRYAS